MLVNTTILHRGIIPNANRTLCGIRFTSPLTHEEIKNLGIDKPFVQQLRNKYPDKWKDRYRDVVKDLSVYNLTITLLEDDISPIPRVKSSRINKKDEERYKKLLG
jgi:hypothetical protein